MSDQSYLISQHATLREAWASMNASRAGIAIVVDSHGCLVETVTDGDIRRAILDSIGLDTPVTEISKRKAKSGIPAPVTASMETRDSDVLQLMLKHKILQIPIIGEEGRVVGLKLLSELVGEPQEVNALIMAGGQGKRLQPLTNDTPKPMLHVGGRPVLERIVEQLRGAGIDRVCVATHYLSEAIRDHFGDGSAFGVQIDYLQEESPLGTAGALGLMEKPAGPLLVINGDILTEVDFSRMVAYHKESEADLTVGVGRYEFQVPYGVVESEGDRLVRLSEKPLVSFFVNAGVYVLQPDVLRFVERGVRVDMPELIQKVVSEGGTATCFPIVEYWLDIGGHSEYDKAQRDFDAK